MDEVTELSVFGFPQNKETETINALTLYGFAYYSSYEEVWRYHVGTFSYLFGVYQTISNMNYEGGFI